MDSDRDIYFKNSREIANDSAHYSVIQWVMALLEGIPNISDGKKSTEELINKLEEVLSDPNDHDTLWCLGNAYVSFTLLIPEPELATHPFSKACMYFQQAFEKDPTIELYWKSIIMNKKEVPELHMLIHAYSPDQKLTPDRVVVYNQTRDMSIFDDPVEWVTTIMNDISNMPGPDMPMTDIISKLEELLSIDRDDDDILWCLGTACATHTIITEELDLATNSFHKACMYFQQAVEKDPTNEMYKKSLKMNNEEVPHLHMDFYEYTSLKLTPPGPVMLVNQARELRNMHEDEPDQQLAGGGSSGSSNITALKARVSAALKENAFEVCQQLLKFVGSFDEEELTDDALRSMETACLSRNQLDLASDCYKDFYPNADMSLRHRLLMGRIRCCYFMEQFEELRKLAYLLAENLVLSKRDPEEVEIANTWLCCAYQLEAYAPYTTNRNDLLQLAAVSVKLIFAQGFITKGGLIMAISLFENLCMHANAMAAIENSPNKQLACDGDVLLIKGRILLKACQYNAACDTFKQVLETCPADWACFLSYLDSLLEGKKSSLSSEEVDSRLSMALDLASQITKESHCDPIFKYRATLEIERRKHLFGNKAKLVDALIQYFKRVGHLSSFIFDITTVLEALCFLGEDGRILINQILKQMYNSFRPVENRPSGTLAGETIRPANVRDFGKIITMHKLQDTFNDKEFVPTEKKKVTGLEQALKGTEFDEEEIAGMKVRRMVEDYYTHLHLSKNIDVEEPIYGEELLSMTFDLLVQIYWRTKNSSCLMEAIEILEFGLTIQKYSHEYSTLLIQIYSFMGAFELTFKHYEKLKLQITNPLLLGECLHNIFPLMLKSPFSAPLKGIIHDYILKMEASMEESLNRTYIGFARTTEVQQVVETYIFINRMKNSHQFVRAKIEDSILELNQNREWFVEQKDFGEEFLLDEGKLKSLTFSEDLSSRPWWTSSPAIDHLLGKRTGLKFEKTLKEDESLGKVLQRRSLIPRLLSLSVQAANESLVEKSEFKKYLQTYARSFTKSLDEAYEFINAAVRGSQLRKDLCSVSDTLDWVNFAVFLFAWTFCEESDFGRNGLLRCKGFDLWYIVVHLVGRLTNHSLEHQEPALAILSGLIQLVREPVSWYVLIAKARLGWLRSTPPGASLSQKKKFKKRAQERKKILGESIKSLQDSLESIFAWLDKPSPSSDNLCPKQYYDIIDLKSCANLGDRLSMAVKSWDRSSVPRNVSSAQNSTLIEFSEMCKRLFEEIEELLKEALV